MIFNVSGGGGTALNFKVVGGTAQPSDPGENTIWVNTDTDISGWVFTPEDPKNPSVGLVWIKTGITSVAPFNALRKNGLYCFPASCKQYVGGSWANKESFIFTGAEWICFSSEIEWIYDNGVTSLSWNGKGADTDTNLVMTVVYSLYGNSYRSCGWKGSTEKVTVPSGSSALNMTYTTSGKFSGLTSKVFGLRTSAYTGSSNSDYETKLDNFAAYVDMKGGTDVTISLPITEGLAGNDYYIGMQANTGSSNIDAETTFTVSKIWFE